MADPIRRWRQNTVAASATGVVAVAASFIWAFMGGGGAIAPFPMPAPQSAGGSEPPGSRGSPDSPEAPESPRLRDAGPATTEAAPFDVAAFDVRLWHGPATEAKPARPTEVPVRLILVGIVHDDGRLRAALYDPEDDRIHLVADGDVVRGLRVVQVGEDRVELAQGQRSHRLKLREDPS